MPYKYNNDNISSNAEMSRFLLLFREPLFAEKRSAVIFEDGFSADKC